MTFWFNLTSLSYFLLLLFIRSPICEEIVGCRGDQVRLAVRCRVFTYPEDTCAVWIMFAVKYKSILWRQSYWQYWNHLLVWRKLENAAHPFQTNVRFLNPLKTEKHVFRRYRSGTFAWCGLIKFKEWVTYQTLPVGSIIVRSQQQIQ